VTEINRQWPSRALSAGLGVPAQPEIVKPKTNYLRQSGAKSKPNVLQIIKDVLDETLMAAGHAQAADLKGPKQLLPHCRSRRVAIMTRLAPARAQPEATCS
jgi:hypothetical protein